MNPETKNQNSTTTFTDDEHATRGYRPRLTFYHANGKGSGSAAQFEVVPACGDRAGAVYMTLARQDGVAGRDGEGTRRYASFDWQNKVIVKLNFNDLCQMLQVFRGKIQTIADGKGLYHDSRNKTTMINLTRQIEPVPGLALDVSRKDGNNPSPRLCPRAEAGGDGSRLRHGRRRLCRQVSSNLIYKLRIHSCNLRFTILNCKSKTTEKCKYLFVNIFLQR